MSEVQVEQKTYQMPPQDGRGVYEPSTSRAEKLSDAAAGWIYVAYFLTVADIELSARFYEKIFGGSHSEQRPAGVHFRSPTRGSLSTLAAVRHPTNQP